MRYEDYFRRTLSSGMKNMQNFFPILPTTLKYLIEIRGYIKTPMYQHFDKFSCTHKSLMYSHTTVTVNHSIALLNFRTVHVKDSINYFGDVLARLWKDRCHILLLFVVVFSTSRIPKKSKSWTNKSTRKQNNIIFTWVYGA